MTENSFKLECRGVDGRLRYFDAVVERDWRSGTDAIQVRVYCAGRNAHYWFDLRLRPHVTGNYRVDAINRNSPRCGGLGVPDALLPEMARRLSCRIYSCVGKDPGDAEDDAGSNEFRTPETEKMWQRLVEKGLASYLRLEDRFVCPSF